MMMSYQLRRAGFCDINRITNGFDSIRFDSIRFDLSYQVVARIFKYRNKYELILGFMMLKIISGSIIIESL
ncbi:MAG: hypothetical protein ACI90V_005957 [Bacillariaceae sp.]|jgi:hypothetical protein